MRKFLTPEIKKNLADQINQWEYLRKDIGAQDKEAYNRYSHYITGFVTALGNMNIRLVYKNNEWIIADETIKVVEEHFDN